MYKIESLDFSKDGFERMDHYQHAIDWPVVYILENGKEAYIGETIQLRNRCRQHYKKPERKKLHSVHIVSDEEYNKSATLDIESSLIQYFAADGVFKLQNGNSGLKSHNYYDRERYHAKFEALIWPQLQEMGLAKHDLVQLRNTDLFKYSPFKRLTEDQLSIVDELMDAITGDEMTFLVHGEPGTGKTIVAVYLMKYLLDHSETSHMKIALVVPMTSLRKTLKKVFRHVVGLKPSMVIGPHEVVKQKYDLLLVDEAHRLSQRRNITNYGNYDKTNKTLKLPKEATQLDWILKSSSKHLFFYDEGQSVRPSDIDPQTIRNLRAKEFRLTSQLRVRGGSDYMAFIDHLFAGAPLTYTPSNQYEVKLFDDFSLFVQSVREKDAKFDLSRIVAGYAWEWKTKGKKGGYDIKIDEVKLRWNSVILDWVHSEGAREEVGCIHTVQGYDLNYVGVIIGPELRYVDGEFVIDRKHYKDRSGHAGVRSDEELLAFIKNIYKTLLTRGMHGVYIYAVDPGVRALLKSRIKK